MGKQYAIEASKTIKNFLIDPLLSPHNIYLQAGQDIIFQTKKFCEILILYLSVLNTSAIVRQPEHYYCLPYTVCNFKMTVISEQTRRGKTILSWYGIPFCCAVNAHLLEIALKAHILFSENLAMQSDAVENHINQFQFQV
ncbi:hypothetical protein ACJX0J_009990 [Zea mays]